MAVTVAPRETRLVEFASGASRGSQRLSEALVAYESRQRRAVANPTFRDESVDHNSEQSNCKERENSEALTIGHDGARIHVFHRRPTSRFSSAREICSL
jgi:hypothetical protein